jgi:hypothetical protein
MRACRGQGRIRRHPNGRRYLTVEIADNVSELHHLDGPQPIERRLLTCPCCLGNFVWAEYQGGAIVLETLGPVSDAAAP